MPATSTSPTQSTSKRQGDREVGSRWRAIWFVGLGISSACMSWDESIPAVDGPLVIEVRNIGEEPLNVTDSVALWGTVGSGLASLTVNGASIAVAPNGGFAALVPLPAEEPAVLQLEARKGEAVVRRGIRVSRVSGQPPAVDEPMVISPTSGWVRLVRPPSDTADGPTQARPIYSRWTPGGALAIALPQQTVWPVVASTEGALRLRLSDGVEAWVPRVETHAVAAPDPTHRMVGPPRLIATDEAVVVEVPLARETATAVDVTRDSITWTIYQASVEGPSRATLRDSLISEVVVTDQGGGRVTATMALGRAVGGWRATHRDGVLRLEVRRRRPPTMTGLRVAIDAGHPPGGTTGPTGLREDSLTLAVAREIARQLQERGAIPLLTRADSAALSLDARLTRAEAGDAHLLISLHADAPGDGRHPSNADHTRIHWWHPHSRSLAAALLATIPDHLEVRRDRVVQSNLAILRNPWFPAALIEPTTLALPEREAALRSPEGVKRYATGVVAAIATWAGAGRE